MSYKSLVIPLIRPIIRLQQKKVNKKYRNSLSDENITLVCSNCFGGFFYHWLGLEFKSPFINLWLTNKDFIEAMKHWDEFLKTPIIEDTTSQIGYPVGIGFNGIRIYFEHYKDFPQAISKWEERKNRMLSDKTFFILSNWNGDKEIISEFLQIPIENKLIFTNESNIDSPYIAYLPGWNPKTKTIWTPMNLRGKRYSDGFDLISWLNNRIK